MKEQENTSQNYIGVDIGKKMLEVVRLSENDKVIRNRFYTYSSGIESFIKWLEPGDIIGMEAGNQTFRLAKTLIKKGYEVIVLNPGDLQTIYKSLKKTDKEDALKIARMLKRFPREELPEVRVPSDEMEDARRLSTEQALWTRQRTILINRLHALFTHAGLTEITKGDLSTGKGREKAVLNLSDRYSNEAYRIIKQIENIEKTLEEVNKEIQNTLNKNIGFTILAMSIPGIGMINTLALFAYLEDCSRFSSGKQLGYYVGLVPRVDSSGETIKYGRIIKRGANGIRRVIIQAAWSHVNTRKDSELTKFFKRLSVKKGKGKAIVAVARKMLEIFYCMIKTGEFYRGTELKDIQDKLQRNGIIKKNDAFWVEVA